MDVSPTEHELRERIDPLVYPATFVEVEAARFKGFTQPVEAFAP